MASPVSDAVAVAQVSVVGAAASRELFGHGPASGAVEGAAGAEEHAAADVDAAVGSERVADHVDGFEVEAFAVPFLVHVEFERVLQVADDAAGGDLQISFGGADEQQVVHVPQLVRDEPAAGDLAGAPAGAFDGHGRRFDPVVGVAEVVVGEPLAQVAADVEAVVALVPVDEVEHEAQQDRVADVAREHRLQCGAVDAGIVFAHVELHEPFAGSFACPSFDRAAGVDGAAIGDAGGLPSAHLRVEQRLEGHDGHMVVDLVAYRFAADDAVFAADRFDAVEVRDPGVAVSAFAYLVGDPFGEPVEVGVGFEEAGHVAAGPFALEVVIDRPADEHGRGAAGVLAMGFQSVSYLDYAGVRRCWMGSGLLAGCSV
ncbi:hypothetical protein BBM1128_02610 [Bifidobacterium breve MCC 1128]|uniref:Uncharacterized protein n=2 Tax=Bifidobacterium TaxID=1678 RepID=A0A0L7B574_BIFBR|nr:hypothetical protein BBM1128_02610 [Bifidobacterium breve MCC 1128]